MTSAAPGSLAFDHVAIPIRDARASHRFYAEVLGLTLIDAMSGDDWGGSPWLMMIFGTRDGQQLALVAFGGDTKEKQKEGDERHYAFAVKSEDELEAWRARLTEAGVEAHDEDHGTQHSLYFTDPNGITLEITTPPTPEIAKPNGRATAIVEEWLEKR